MRSKVPGDERVYVKVDGGFTYSKWIESLRSGRSFVSDGPLLELSADGQGIGAVLELPAAKEVPVKAAASYQIPLERVELLYNGKVIATAQPTGGELTIRIEQRLKLGHSGWLALRAVGPAAPDCRSDRVFAQTSPVYVTVAGKPAGTAEDARYFLGWIDRLEQAVRS